MKEKTSIKLTLSSDVLAQAVLGKYLREQVRSRVQARDLERINAAADRLNSKAAEVLEFIRR